MSDIKSGRHGRPQAVASEGIPLGVSMAAQRLHDEPDTDWLMTAGWLVMRQWETPTDYVLVFARVVHESGTYEVEP